MDKTTEHIMRMRMHGLYLSRKCDSITRLSHELLGLHCWFHRNVAFSALIRGANLIGWKSTLTKTWLYRGTLHGVVFEDLPLLLGLHSENSVSRLISDKTLADISDRVVSLMEDGVYSRAEMRRIFADKLDEQSIERVFSPWGGIFVHLARAGRVAFRDMTSRDFDLIDAQPNQPPDKILPELLRRFFTVYGPATLTDAAWFFGLTGENKKRLTGLNLDEFSCFEHNKNTYYYTPHSVDMSDIPELTLLSGFDPLIVSYADRSAILPPEYKRAAILRSGICLPTIAVNGKVAGLWNIRKRETVVEFFAEQPKRIKDEAFYLAENIRRQTEGII